MRGANLPPPPKVEKQARTCWMTEIRKYKIITPLFGGGEVPHSPDIITVVRASEVRGHLRFWWRATRGGMFHGNLAEMKRREEEIWGSAGDKGKPGPSNIIISLSVSKRGNDFQAINQQNHPINNIGSPSSKHGYVAFPLRDEQNPVVKENIEFELRIDYPDEITINKGGHRDEKIKIGIELKAALWAWETFGGIGARTRRGFGALQCVEVNGHSVTPPTVDEFDNWLKDQLNQWVTSGSWPDGVPHLSQSLNHKIKKGKEPGKMWHDLFRKLKDFRQSRYHDKSGRPLGRSKWPEPNAIRRLTKTFAPSHKSSKSSVDKFPRAKFGLPIIFEFKKDDVAHGDPARTTLQGGDELNRLASPLILRPIACAGGAVGLAAILEWQPRSPSDEAYTPPGGLVLKTSSGGVPVKSDLTPQEAKNIPPLHGQTDVLQAFLDFLTK